MVKRVLSSIIGLTLLILIVGIAPNYVLYIATGIVCIMGLKEFYDAVKLKTNLLRYFGYLLSVIYIFLVYKNGIGKVGIFNSVLIIVLLILMVIRNDKVNLKQVIYILLGHMYIVTLLTFIPMVKSLDNGYMYVWLIFLISWGTDTGAYLIGTTMGKHKLIPKLSPKKTIEGAIGGIVFSMILLYVYIIAIKYNNISYNMEFILGVGLLGIIGSIISQVGDLSASAIKRYVGIKDFGNIIPGHGGILDRFDSILLVAPLIYYIVSNWLI